MAKRESKRARLRRGMAFFAKMPRQLPSVRELMDTYSALTVSGLAEALGVSERSVTRWRSDGGSHLARVAVWWMTDEGQSFWDAELHHRMRLALQMNEALWREVGVLRSRVRELEAASSLTGETAGTVPVDLVDQAEVVELRRA